AGGGSAPSVSPGSLMTHRPLPQPGSGPDAVPAAVERDTAEEQPRTGRDDQGELAASPGLREPRCLRGPVPRWRHIRCVRRRGAVRGPVLAQLAGVPRTPPGVALVTGLAEVPRVTGVTGVARLTRVTRAAGPGAVRPVRMAGLPRAAGRIRML